MVLAVITNSFTRFLNSFGIAKLTRSKEHVNKWTIKMLIKETCPNLLKLGN